MNAYEQSKLREIEKLEKELEGTKDVDRYEYLQEQIDILYACLD